MQTIARLDGVPNFVYSAVPIWRCTGRVTLFPVVRSCEHLLRVTHDTTRRFGLAAKVTLPEGLILGEFVGAIRHRNWRNRAGQRNRSTGERDIRAMNVVTRGSCAVHHVLDMGSVANFSVLLNHDSVSPSVGAVRLDALGTRVGVIMLRSVMPGEPLTVDYGSSCERVLGVV